MTKKEQMKKHYVNGKIRIYRVSVSDRYTDARIPKRLFALLAGAILFGLLVPLVGHPYRQFVTAISMFGVVVFCFSMVLSMRTPSRGVVKIAMRAPLHFLSPLATRIGILVGSICAVAFGVLSILSGPFSGEVMVKGAQSGLHIYGALIGGLLGIGYAIRCGISPFGVELSPRGIRWQHWSSKVEVPWEDLSNVNVELGIYNRSRNIFLRDKTNGTAERIDLSVMGSDPVIIAETIAYFLAYPKERETLNDPIAALSLVMDLSEASELRTR